MPRIVHNGQVFSSTGSPAVTLSQAQYNALSTEEKNNGTLYFIVDAKTSVGDIDDVSLSTPAVGDTLTWNGTKWVNVGVQTLTPTINTQQTNFEPYFTDNTQYVRQGNMIFLNFGVTCNSTYDTHPGVLYMSGLPAPKTNNNGSLFYDCIAPFNPTKRVRCMIDSNGNLNIRFGNATDVFDINIFYVCM